MSNHSLFDGQVEASLFQQHNYDDLGGDDIPADLSTNARAYLGEGEEFDGVEEPDGDILGELEEETPVELLASQAPKYPRALQNSTKMLVRMAKISGHQCGHTGCGNIDKVDEQREQEKLQLDTWVRSNSRHFLKDGGLPPEPEEKIEKLGNKPFSGHTRWIAAMLKCHPRELKIPRYIATLPISQKLKLIKLCILEASKKPIAVLQEDGSYQYGRPDFAGEWNRQVFGLAELPIRDAEGNPTGEVRVVRVKKIPELHATGSISHNEASRLFHSRLAGVSSIPRLPGAPEQVALTGFPRAARDQSAVVLSADWMRRAEAGEELWKNDRAHPGKKIKITTQCLLTNDNLILKRKKASVGADLKLVERPAFWKIGPNIRGFGVKGARMLVDNVALRMLDKDVLTEAYGKEVVGIEGKPAVGFVKQLMEDPDAWAILAAHTGHRVWAKYARFLLMLRNVLFLKLDEKNQRDNTRIAAQIKTDLMAAYPDAFNEDQELIDIPALPWPAQAVGSNQ